MTERFIDPRQLLDLDLAARNVSQATSTTSWAYIRSDCKRLRNPRLSTRPVVRRKESWPTSTQHCLAIDCPGKRTPSVATETAFGCTTIAVAIAERHRVQEYVLRSATVGLNEFNPLFLQEGLNAQFFGSLGESGAYGEQAILTGLEGPISFAVSQLASWTDGIRENNDDDVEQFDAFVQAQLGATSSAQLEISHSEREYGDVLSAFDPEFFSPAIRNTSEIDIQRLGFRHVIDVKSDLLISVVRQERLGTVDVRDPFFPTFISNDQDGWKFELQYLGHVGESKFVAGVAYSDARNEFEVTSPFIPVFRRTEPHHYSAYGYWHLPSPGRLPECSSVCRLMTCHLKSATNQK